MDRDTLILEALRLGRIGVDFEIGEVYSTRQRGKEGLKIVLKGSLCNGYAVHRLYLNGIKKQVRAHRIIWMAMCGKIPKGKCIDHINRIKTDNRLKNLRLVSVHENATNRRSFRGENNPSAKLTETEVRLIRTLISLNIPYREIAEDFMISKSEVGNIAKESTWNPHWMGRIKCCGNAVVPQVAQFIARRIGEIEFLGRT